ncbi:MAG TPA: hypothetical protein VGD81_06735 [Opitutaceae bacterium]
MKTFKLLLLSSTLVAASFAAPVNSPAPDKVIELPPVVVETTRLTSPAQSSLDELKSIAVNAPARVPVAMTLITPATVRDGQRLAARTGSNDRVAPVSLPKSAPRVAASSY